VNPSARAALVKQTLDKMGGGVTLRELVYQTKLPRDEVLDALIDLEERGQAAVYSWCSTDVFARMLAWASDPPSGEHHDGPIAPPVEGGDE
jgi:hypothetical protein